MNSDGVFLQGYDGGKTCFRQMQRSVGNHSQKSDFLGKKTKEFCFRYDRCAAEGIAENKTKEREVLTLDFTDTQKTGVDTSQAGGSD
jgi:hypothetical protein